MEMRGIELIDSNYRGIYGYIVLLLNCCLAGARVDAIKL
jgi:hypothetical protein